MTLTGNKVQLRPMRVRCTFFIVPFKFCRKAIIKNNNIIWGIKKNTWL